MTVDCHAKVVKFEMPDELRLIFQGDSCLTSIALITSLVALHLMDKGNQRFLALVCNVEAQFRPSTGG